MKPSATVPPHGDAPSQGSTRHPAGLRTLFFTEMWERFSFYGMRALLVLFMVDNVRGGLGLTDRTATAIYGLYTAAVYLAALPGGWMADRLLGAQRAVWWGGWIIAIGHFVLAVPGSVSFYLGLALVVAGTGLLKPNISTMVGDLYPEGGARRDAGFTVFYMGINLGAALGPLVCSYLGERFRWHYGFGAAGVGMLFGLLQFRLSRERLGSAGRHPGNPARLNLPERVALLGAIVLLPSMLALGLSGQLRLDPVAIARATTSVIVGIAAAYFAGILLFGGLDPSEKRRVGVIALLFLSSALFWAGFEQVGSSFNLFAERHTERTLAGFVIPTGWFQSLGPVFIIAFAPLFASLWVALARRHLDPSVPMKFGLGLILLAAGFLVMALAAGFVVAGGKVWPTWLIVTYLLHTFGELCLSPVGLSSVTKLAPRRLVGQMMGIWFLATSLGNLIAGLLAGAVGSGGASMAGQFLQMTVLPAAAGLVLVALARPIERWTRGRPE